MSTIAPSLQTALNTLNYYDANLRLSDAIADQFADDISYKHVRMEERLEITKKTGKSEVLKLFQEKLFSQAKNVTMRKLSMKIRGWTADVNFEVEYNVKEDGTLKRYAFVDKTRITYDPQTWKIVQVAASVEKFPLPASDETQVSSFLSVNEYLQSCFTLDAGRLKKLQAEHIKWTFSRLKGGFETGERIELSGRDPIKEHMEKQLKNTSDYSIRGIDITINGQHASVISDVTENKVRDDVMGRYHMSCNETITFDSEGKIVEQYSRNTCDPIPMNAR